MEQAKGYEKKLVILKQSLESLHQSIIVDTSGLDEIILDAVKSGQAQKFEICVELFWKLVKKFLYEVHGIESVSPKMVMKQLYRSKYVNEKNYETLIEMVNDRNRLSHVYNETQFNEIHKRLSEYQSLMMAIVKSIDPLTKK